ncbi:MAG: hypothetical protein ABSD74_14450 [Rhizomicrobium sp.]|jgi:hypothetical protein
MRDPAYRTAISESDVHDKRALDAFRAKRAEWLHWLKWDEHHAISIAVSSMVWADVRFRALARAGEVEPDGGLNNPLVMELLIEGHFATQTLAIRRLMDNPRSGVISLANLLKDIARNIGLFTRENFVAFDGLPYDYAAARARVVAEHVGRGPFWAAREGPDAWDTSERAHAMFDQLSGVVAANRNRTDRIPRKHIETLQQWMVDSEAETIVDWADNFLAHAGDPRSRGRVDLAAVQPNLTKIENAVRCFVRVSEALLAYLLFDSGHGVVMPVPQFNQFERMDKPLVTNARLREVRTLWDGLETERNGYLSGVLEEMLSAPPVAERVEDATSVALRQ